MNVLTHRIGRPCWFSGKATVVEVQTLIPLPVELFFEELRPFEASKFYLAKVAARLNLDEAEILRGNLSQAWGRTTITIAQ
jgi:hypothetical protein